MLVCVHAHRQKNGGDFRVHHHYLPTQKPHTAPRKLPARLPATRSPPRLCCAPPPPEETRANEDQHVHWGQVTFATTCGGSSCAPEAAESGPMPCPCTTSTQRIPSSTLQHPAATASPCTSLQHPALHCNTMQRTATHCLLTMAVTGLRQHAAATASRCNILQHPATHCNTLSTHHGRDRPPSHLEGEAAADVGSGRRSGNSPSRTTPRLNTTLSAKRRRRCTESKSGALAGLPVETVSVCSGVLLSIWGGCD